MIPGGKHKLCACGCGTPLDDKRVDALWATDACRKRGYAPASTEKGRNRSMSGRQLPYVKTVRHAIKRLAPYVEADRVQEALDECLPERQRQESRA